MPRIPVIIVIFLSLATVLGTWFAGTRHYDFLTPPSDHEIQMARSKATQALAHPSDLFALPPVVPEAPVVEEEPEPASPPAPPPPPEIPLTELPDPLPQNFWVNQSEFPPASFLNAGEKLEAESKSREALVAFERVIDHTSASKEEIEAAVKGVRRNRSSMAIPPEATKDAPTVKLRLRTPPNRVGATRKAARVAAETLAQSAFRQIKFEAWITPDRQKKDHLTLALERPDDSEPATADIPVNDDIEELRSSMLMAAYRIIASSLALDPSLRPISQPPEGEPAEDSLSTRITRRAWSRFLPPEAPETPPGENR